MSKRYSVLLVEDNEFDRMAFERFIQTANQHYNYAIAGSVEEAKKILTLAQFDIALVDYSLGDGTCLDLFEAAHHIPIIVITGANDLHVAVEVMKAGAYDFLCKDPRGNYLTTLPITVKKTLERWEAQQELALYRNHLEKVIAERTAAWLEGELHLRTIVDSTLIIIFSLNAQGIITFVAGHTQDIIGYSSEELIGKPLVSLFARDPNASVELHEIFSQEGFNHDVEMNGHWLSINTTTKWENNAVTGVIGVINDISERKQAELAISQERNLLRTLIDNIPDYIFIKDRDERFVETNRAHAAAANLSREQIINRTAMEVFDLEVAEQFHADDSYVMTSGQSIINEERLTTNADGNQRWVLTTKVPLFDDHKHTIIGLVGISRDITERRKAEEERRKAERLRIEIEQERELVEMKQRFIATATHDFRTPLTFIKMSADTLEAYETRLSSEKRLEKLKQIQSQVDNMVRLLDDVLVVSKVSAGRVEFSPHTFDLVSFCHSLWEDMIAMDQGKHQCQLEFVATPPNVTADTRLMQYILVNLLSNAFKYTPVGGTICFHIENDDQSITFRIQDTGYGIPEADQKHLFEPFYRAGNVKNIQGTGLGLVIVKAYVELHKGTIAFQSTEGGGTTFTVQLPYQQ